MKRRGDKIVMVTAYDAPGARFAEDAGIDIVLVGDTAAMVVLGHEGTTVPVTIDEMLFLTRTVARSARPADRRRRHAVRLVPGVRRGRGRATPIRFVKEGGADVVKLEGAGPMVSRVARDRRGRDPGDGPHRPDAAVGDDARRLQDAGPDGRGGARASSTTRTRSRTPAASRSCSRRSRRRSPRGSPRQLSIPTIGIGAGPDCDGQVLVYHDLLGLTEGHLPRFVKRYANLSREIRDALEAYAAEVRTGAFPQPGAHVRDARGRARPPSTPTSTPARASCPAPVDDGALGDAPEHAGRLGQRRRAEVAGDAELGERRAEVEALAVPAAELGDGVPPARRLDSLRDDLETE